MSQTEEFFFSLSVLLWKDFYWQFSYAILLYPGLVITIPLRKVSCLLNVEATTLVKAKKMKEGGGLAFAKSLNWRELAICYTVIYFSGFIVSDVIV